MPPRVLMGAASLTAVIGLALGVLGSLVVLRWYRHYRDSVRELRDTGGL